MKSQQYQLSRRELLALGSLSIAAASTSGLLPSLAMAAAEEKVKHKSCICLFMDGGPSHLDTFDPKPNAPEGRGGPLKTISTSLPGVQITELFPQLSQRMHEICTIRSMNTPAREHGRAKYLLRTGRLPRPNMQFPGIGSITSSEIGDPHSSLPNYVFLGDRAGRGGGASAGYLGPFHEPLCVESDRVNRATPATSEDRFVGRLQLLNALESELQKNRPTDLAVIHRAVVERSVNMMRSEHLSAFEIGKESPQLLKAYGDSNFGKNCLRARRLIEVGVPFVEVVSQHWDHHSAMYSNKGDGIKALSAEVDAAMSALLDDLRSRGLLDSTLIVWVGEFGRTPKIRPLPGGGREHYSDAWTTLLAGAGLKAGQVIGRTDASGAKVEERPVSAADFMATICLALGIDPHKKLDAPNDRPIPIVDDQTQTPKPLVELLG
jgi:hypothetical protein